MEITEKEAAFIQRAMGFGECLSTDEFMRWWQDPWLRAQIHAQAARWSRSREDYQDLWAEAWAAICGAPPDISLDAIWHVDEQGRPTRGVAYRAIHNEFRAQRRHSKKFVSLAGES